MNPPPPPDRQQKRQTLRRHGTLNPHPEAVSHPLFHNSDFFDSDDLMQVKYEMLRQVHIDKRVNQRFGAGLRFLTPIVLSGAGRAPTGRHVRLASAQARPARWAQTDRRGDGVCHRAASCRFFVNSRATCRSHSAAVPDSGASAEHSAVLAAAKKRR